MKKIISKTTIFITTLLSFHPRVYATGPFRPIDPPYAEPVYQRGLIGLISTLIQVAAVAAGIFSLINLIIAGYLYLSSNGEPKNVQLAWQRINFSLIGLLIIVGSYTIAILIGALIFGDPEYIVNPQITGPGGN